MLFHGPPSPKVRQYSYPSRYGGGGAVSSFKNNVEPTYLTNSPIIPKKPRWVLGWIVLSVVTIINFVATYLMRSPAPVLLSIPVLWALSRGFQQEQHDATRRCALEGFVKGAVLGPAVLGMVQFVSGIVLALLCFGQKGFEAVLASAQDFNELEKHDSFSKRLFNEANAQDPIGATIFAFTSSMLVAGLSEEAFKMIVGARQVYKYRAHRRVLQPIEVLAGVGLGLAYSESMVAISGLRGAEAFSLAAERLWTTFPVHVFCAVWSARRASQLEDSWLLCVLPSAVAHGVFDFGIIMCRNIFSRRASLAWSFSAAAATTVAGLNF